MTICREFNSRDTCQMSLSEIVDEAVRLLMREDQEDLADNPRARGCIKLSGRQEHYRVHVGSYRILYEVRDEVLVANVVRIGHRSGVYD